MAAIFPWGIGMGIAAYLSKFMLFMMLPAWVKKVAHYNNLTLIMWDVAMGYSVAHLAALATGYLVIIVVITFGFCSALYITTRSFIISAKGSETYRNIRCWI